MDEIIDVGLNSNRFQSFNYMAYAINKTFTYANNALFYSQINPTYFDYYNRIVKVNLEWFDGYVSGFHSNENGIFSTRIATALVNGIISNVFSTKLVYDRGNESEDYKAIDFFSKWSKDHQFLESIKTLSKFSGASGTAVLKLNQSYGDIWCQTLRQDQFIYSTNSKGDITEITMFMKPYEDLNNKHDNYYIVEKRYFTKDVEITTNVVLENGKVKAFKKKPNKPVPVVEYKILYYRGQILQNTMISDGMSETNWYNLNPTVKEMIKKDFSDLYFGKAQILPFKNSLGCFALQINGKDPTISTGSMGYAFLTDIRTYLIEYELLQAYSIRDAYNGQGQVAVPKAMSMNDLDNSPYNVNKSNFEMYPGDPDKQTPIVVQFDLRAEEWVKKINHCLQKMATTLGMSPKVIASYLNTAWSNSFGKTATEVESDDSNNQIFLEDKRENIISFLDKVIPFILRFYGFSNTVRCRFLKTNANPTSQDLKDIDFKYQNGYIDLREALREMNPTVSEQELDVLEEKSRARQEEMKAKTELQINSFGDYGE